MQACVKQALVGIVLIARSQTVEYSTLSASLPPSPLLLHPLELLEAAAKLLKPMTDTQGNKRLNDACRILTLTVRDAPEMKYHIDLAFPRLAVNL